MSTKRKLDMVARPSVKQSAKPLEKQRLNETKAVVISGGGIKVNGQHDVVEISSDEEEDEESEEEGSSDEEIAGDVSMGDAAEDEEEADDLAQPSFGDLVRINAAETIDVANAFDDPSSTALKKSGENQNIESRLGASLGTVLTQALKTNDQSLLEQCLQETDLQTVRLTLQRLASPLASNLLHHLASRLHRRPGRAGSLIVWIQWALVTHGGYLATQPGLNKELEELHRVVDERSRGLQPLLHLKGKLDMLEAQLKLRKSMQHRPRNPNNADEEDEEAVIYVEGEESDDEEEINGAGNKGRTITNGAVDVSDASSEVSEDMPNTNGIIADSEEDEEDDDSEGEGLVDDEAEETDADSGDEDEVDFDDQDEVEEEEDSEDEKDAPPPSKLQKVSSTFSRQK